MSNNKITRGKIKCAYAAGGIDADGSISICKVNLKDKTYKNPRHVLEITYTNTYEPIVKWYQDNFGGSWTDIKKRDRRNENAIMTDGRIIKAKQITYQWKITSQKGLEFLKQIKPFLVGKKRQAEIAILFQENILNRKMITVKAGRGLSHRLAPEELEKREWCHQMVMALNKHTISPAETKRSNPYEKG